MTARTMRSLPRHAALLLVMGAHAVYADPISGDDTREAAIVEPVFPPIARITEAAVPLTSDEVGVEVRADLVAGGLATTEGAMTEADGRTIGGAVTASAEVAVTPKEPTRCDVAHAGGLASTRSDSDRVALSQWASACLVGGRYSFLKLDHRLDWDVTSRLLAVPRDRPGIRRRETFGLYGDGKRALQPAGTPFEGMDLWNRMIFELEFSIGWGGIESRVDVGTRIHVLLAGFEQHFENGGPPFEVAFADVQLASNGFIGGSPATSGLTTAIMDFARVEGLRVGDLRLGARLAGRLGMMTDATPDGRPKQGDADTLEGGISVETGRAVVVRGELDRRAYGTWNGRLLVDNRATAKLQASYGRVALRAEATLSRTRLRAPFGDDIAITGGFAAQAELALSSHFALRLYSELGRSLYAPGATADAPRWASETMLLLAANAQRRR